MADGLCRVCNSYTPLVYDHTSGDTICSECGLVLASHSGDKPGPGFTITTAKGSGSSLKRHGPEAEDQRARALEAMEEMAGNLGVAEGIRKRAKEVYRKAEEEKVWGRQRNPRAVMGACLYVACQEEGYPRTLKEIYGVGEGARMKEIHKCMEILKKKREAEVGRRGSGIVHARDIARRYCANLGLSHRTIRAVQEAVQKTEDYDIRRNSTSILAAAIFMVTQLSENKMSLREVAQASEVAEGTVKKAYKDLYPHASVLIPSWYANDDDIKRLCVL